MSKLNNKIKLFIYWMSDKNKSDSNFLKNILNISNNNNFEIIVGPSKQEHDFLMKDNKNYKYYIDNKKYVFASDIYRIWLGTKYQNFIYIDSTINVNFDKLKSLVKKNQNKSIFAFESHGIIWSGFFYISNLKKVFQDCYEWTKRNKIISSPLLLTKFLRKHKLIKNFEKYNKNLLTCFDISFLNFNNNNFDVIKINPKASWRTQSANEIWSKKINSFYKNKNRDRIFLLMPDFIKRFIFKLIN